MEMRKSVNDIINRLNNLTANLPKNCSSNISSPSSNTNKSASNVLNSVSEKKSNNFHGNHAKDVHSEAKDEYIEENSKRYDNITSSYNKKYDSKVIFENMDEQESEEYESMTDQVTCPKLTETQKRYLEYRLEKERFDKEEILEMYDSLQREFTMFKQAAKRKECQLQIDYEKQFEEKKLCEQEIKQLKHLNNSLTNEIVIYTQKILFLEQKFETIASTHKLEIDGINKKQLEFSQEMTNFVNSFEKSQNNLINQNEGLIKMIMDLTTKPCTIRIKEVKDESCSDNSLNNFIIEKNRSAQHIQSNQQNQSYQNAQNYQHTQNNHYANQCQQNYQHANQCAQNYQPSQAVQTPCDDMGRKKVNSRCTITTSSNDFAKCNSNNFDSNGMIFGSQQSLTDFCNNRRINSTVSISSARMACYQRAQNNKQYQNKMPQKQVLSQADIAKQCKKNQKLKKIAKLGVKIPPISKGTSMNQISKPNKCIQTKQTDKKKEVRRSKLAMNQHNKNANCSSRTNISHKSKKSSPKLAHDFIKVKCNDKTNSKMGFDQFSYFPKLKRT